MKKMITIAVDAMGGDNSPLKIIDGIELHHKKSKNVFYKIFGNKNIIDDFVHEIAHCVEEKFAEDIYEDQKLSLIHI